MSNASQAREIANRFLGELLSIENTDEVVAYANAYLRHYAERLRSDKTTTGDYVAATAFALLIMHLLEIAERRKRPRMTVEEFVKFLKPSKSEEASS